jgi:hypothetical protein
MENGALGPELPVANVRNAVAGLSSNCGIVANQLIFHCASLIGIPWISDS